MTPLNTIIEEEKTIARNKFENAFVDVREEELGSVWKRHSNPDLIPEMLSEIITTALQRAYEAGKADWLRSEIEKVEGMKQTNVYHTLHCIKGLAENHEHCVRNLTGAESGWNAAITSIITRYKEELLELDKTNGF